MRQTHSALITERSSRFFIPDVLAFATLLAIAWWAAGFLLRDDVFIFGDHPGRYWLMWYSLNVAWPQHQRVITWIPHWYAGFPELQFYPPGFVLLGWLFNVLTFGALSTALIYEMVVFAAFVLPGLTCYYAIRHLQFGRRAAFAAGLFGLIYPAIIGGAGGPVIGMIGSRLAFGLNPLVLVWILDFIEARGAWYFGLASLVLAAAILAHPYHEIGIMLAVGLYILVRRLPLVQASLRWLTVIIAAVAFDAFWLLPLVAHSATEMIPVIRDDIMGTWVLYIDPALLPYALLAWPALVSAWRNRDSHRGAVAIALSILPFLLGAVIFGIHLVLIQRLNYYQFDPVRFLGEVYLSVILVSSIGLSRLDGWISKSIKSKSSKPWLPAGTVTILVCAVLLFRYFQAHSYFDPQVNDEPRFLSQAVADYKLAELWDVLRATPGRVMFTSFYSHLSAYGEDTLPTTLPSLTPIFTQRQLMGGTFTLWSPLAAFMWVGKLNPPVLTGSIEAQDDRALFGIPLERLSPDQLYAYCERFNITTLVARVDDFRTRTFLDASPRFQSYYNNGFFFAYRVKGYENSWIDAQHASVELTDLTDQQIHLRVRAADADAIVRVKIYAYPLWRAFVDNGQELAIRKDDTGLIRIVLPRGEDYSVTLRYEEGTVEQIGNLISIVSWVIFMGAGVLILSRR